jgi:hypothetical protein
MHRAINPGAKKFVEIVGASMWQCRNLSGLSPFPGRQPFEGHPYYDGLSLIQPESCGVLDEDFLEIVAEFGAYTTYPIVPRYQCLP